MTDDEIHECRGVIFPEKKPTTKTGETYPNKLHDDMIKNHIVLHWADDRSDEQSMKDFWDEVADFYDMTPRGISDIAKRFEHLKKTYVKQYWKNNPNSPENKIWD